MTDGVPEKGPAPPSAKTEPAAAPTASAPPAPAAKTDWRKHIRSGAIVLAAAIILIVVFQNTDPTPYRILWVRQNPPLWLLLLFHFFAGAAAALIAAHLWRKRRARPPAAK